MKTVEEFLYYLTADRGYSQGTITAYHNALLSLYAFYRSKDEALDWTTLDTDVIRQWMMACMERGQVARTVAKQLSAVRSLYKYLLRIGRIDTDPTRLIKNPKVHAPLPTFLRRSEVDNLFDRTTFADDFDGCRDRTLLLTFYHTGVRMAELIGLDVADIDMTQAELKVTGKRNKQRIVPFGSELTETLQQYLEKREAEGFADRAALFLNHRGERISRSQVGTIVRTYLTLVTTQKKRSPHVLRHTFATEMINNGADIEAIKELLGHESIATTEVYTHITLEDLKKEYQHAHPRA